MFSKVKIRYIANSSLGEVRPRAAMFVVNFANFKYRALSRDPSADRVMPRAEVRIEMLLL